MSALNPRQSKSLASFDLCQKDIALACDNFMSVNEQRIQRAKHSLSSQQQVFLEALPLLLHINHPLLPGFISNITPSGISGFEPNKHHIQAIRSLSKSFNYNAYRKRNDGYIHNISLMGSTGTVAHSKNSDMDFWICYDPEISHALLSELELKLRAIEKWASTLGLEVYFFPMNLEQFKSGQRKDVSGEDCGTAQHFLLLDEFYRTSLLIAGRKPLWWAIPADYERTYQECVNYIVNHQLIDTKEFCDFGGIPTIPAGEFIGAGMWQLYKGVDAPYKSVIKILLTEVYASEYPQVNCLSHIYKESIYKNNTSINELDPYVMLYRKLEKYLVRRNEIQRLELVRRCFYFKVNEPLGRSSTIHTIPWRRRLMEEMVSQWGWESDYPKILDARKFWKAHRTINERKALVNELNHSYRFLSRFARDYKSSVKISQHDMTVLGRRLYAAFERKSGKIELINPNISIDITEPRMTFIHKGHRLPHDTNNLWLAYSGNVSLETAESQEPIKRSRSIIELAGWCYFNEIISSNTRITLRAENSDMSEHELIRILQTFNNEFPNKLPAASQENFNASHHPIRQLQFINVGIDPMRHLNKKGIQKITEQTDALNFSGTHTNLIQSIEQISINSWHEIITTKFDGNTAVIDSLLDFLRHYPLNKNQKPPKKDILCFCQTRPEGISKRVTELFLAIEDCFYSDAIGDSNNRFLLETEYHFYLFEIINKQPRAHHFSNYHALLKHLRKTRKTFSPIKVDTSALRQKNLKTVCHKMASDSIQIFFTIGNTPITDIYVVDELGSIQHFNYPTLTAINSLIHLHQFLQSVWYRLESELGRVISNKKEPILFYQLSSPTHGKEGQATLINPNNFTKNFSNDYAVQAVIEDNDKGHISHTLFCDHKEFSELEFGNNLFNVVAKHIFSMENFNSTYPIYITDIDLTQCRADEGMHHQTTKYLQYKLILENRLNDAARHLN